MVPCQLLPLRYLPLLTLAAFKSPQSLPVYFWIQVKYSSLCRFGLVLLVIKSVHLPVFSCAPGSLFALIVSLHCRSTLAFLPQVFLLEDIICASLCRVCMAQLNSQNKVSLSYLGNPSAKPNEELHSTCGEQTNKTNFRHNNCEHLTRDHSQN